MKFRSGALYIVNALKVLIAVKVLAEPNNAYDNKFDFTYAVVATSVVLLVIAWVGKF